MKAPPRPNIAASAITELYDHATNGAEYYNIIGIPANAPLLKELRIPMEAELGARPDAGAPAGKVRRKKKDTQE